MAGDDRTETVICAGELTIGRATELHDLLLGGLSSGCDIEVDCSGAEAVDLTFVQLLLAARSSAARRGVGLRLKGGGGVLHDVVRAGGLAGIGNGFWDGGG